MPSLEMLRCINRCLPGNRSDIDKCRKRTEFVAGKETLSMATISRNHSGSNAFTHCRGRERPATDTISQSQQFPSDNLSPRLVGRASTLPPPPNGQPHISNRVQGFLHYIARRAGKRDNAATRIHLFLNPLICTLVCRSGSQRTVHALLLLIPTGCHCAGLETASLPDRCRSTDRSRYQPGR